MLIGPGHIQTSYDSFKRNRTPSESIFDHLRANQNQVWNGLSSVLTFDGIMSATAAVLGSGQAKEFYDPGHLQWVLRFSMYAYLASAVVALLGLNLHGRYDKAQSADDAERIYLSTTKTGARFGVIAMWISLAGTALLVAALMGLGNG